MQKYAVAFPARDAFYIGLSTTFYEEYESFRNIYELASNYMGEDLYEISYKKSSLKPELHMVCLLTHCYGAYNILTEYLHMPSASLGLSQGEFTAITASGSIKFPEILKLVYNLELLIIQNEQVKEGIMARVMELDREKVRECCRYVDPYEKKVSIAMYLSNEQNIISGQKDAVDRACTLAKEKGAKWTLKLSSGGGFHSPICSAVMENARSVFNMFEFKDSLYLVYSCVDGIGSLSGERIKERISTQISKPVLLDKLILNLKADSVERIIELGSGCTICGNTRIIDHNLECCWVNNTKDLSYVLKLFE